MRLYELNTPQPILFIIQKQQNYATQDLSERKLVRRALVV